MPKKPSKIAGRNVEDNLTGADIEFLQNGFAFAGFSEPDPAKARRLWKLYKAKGLLKAFIDAHPGTRPWAFWTFECKEPFKVIGRSATPASFPNTGKYRVSDVREIELQTLERLGLLTEGEKERALEVDNIREQLERQKSALFKYEELRASLPADKFIEKNPRQGKSQALNR